MCSKPIARMPCISSYFEFEATELSRKCQRFFRLSVDHGRNESRDSFRSEGADVRCKVQLPVGDHARRNVRHTERIGLSNDAIRQMNLPICESLREGQQPFA